MRQKGKLLGVLALTSLFVFPSAAKAGQLNELDNYQEQIDTFMDEVDVWYAGGEVQQGSLWNGLAVTDIDQDGQLEVIKCSLSGTGLVSMTEICQNMPGGGFMMTSDGSSGDMGGRDVFTVYQEPESGVNCYMMADIGRDGAAYSYETKKVMCYFDRNLITANLVKHEEYYDEVSGEKTDRYTDISDNTITKEEFDNIEDTTFADYRKRTVIFNWVERPADASLGQVRDLLEQSAEGFYYGDAKKSEWFENNGNWYYFDENSMPFRGWNQINDVWYCFDGSGVMMTDWNQINDVWYYFNENGAMATGWQQLGGSWYYFDGSGAMVTGWNQIGGNWYYFDGSGAMATGWQQLGGSWYYFDGSGAMATGWQQLGGSWYYLDGSGAMATGWQQLGGSWYYFDGSGAMAASTWIGDCYVNASGVWV